MDNSSSHSNPPQDPKVIKRIKDIGETDLVVLVVGVTGSGKSSFVKSLTGHDTGIGHGLESSTNEIHMVSVPFEDRRRLVVVDTPGFDHTRKSDADILSTIASWLKDLYKHKRYLAGLVCLCPVDRPLGASAMKPLYVTKEMAGRQAMDIIKFATTLWSSSNPSRAEEERVAKQISDIVNAPAEKLRASDADAASRMLDGLLERTQKEHHPLLQVQREMVEERRSVDKTTVAQKFFTPMERSSMKGKWSGNLDLAILDRLSAKLRSLKVMLFFAR